MKKLLKKILAPVMRELIKNDAETKKIIRQQVSEALEKAMGNAVKSFL